MNQTKENVDYFTKRPFPLLNSDLEYGEFDNKVNGISYYTVSKLNNSSQIGLSINGKFQNYFEESNVVLFGLESFEFTESDDNVYLYGDGFKAFDSYTTLNSINININTNYEVVDCNADKIVDNVYTWNINRNNYETKTIYISANKTTMDKMKKNISNKVIATPNKWLIVTVSLFIIVLIVIYLVLHQPVQLDYSYQIDRANPCALIDREKHNM